MVVEREVYMIRHWMPKLRMCMRSADLDEELELNRIRLNRILIEYGREWKWFEME